MLLLLFQSPSAQGKTSGPTPFQVANAAAAGQAGLKTSTGTIVRRNGSSGRVATLSSRVPSSGGPLPVAGGAVDPASESSGGPSAVTSVMTRSDSTSSASSSNPSGTHVTPLSPKLSKDGRAASRSTSSASLASSANTAQNVGRVLYCSPECAAADRENNELAVHLSEVLHLYSPLSNDGPWSPQHEMSLPSPFLVSGSDSESGDYFHHRSDEVDPLKQPLGFIAHGAGARRSSVRSATTATTNTTTGSSSDSLASLWDHPHHQAPLSSSNLGHSTSSRGLRRMTPLHPMTTPPPLSPIASEPISARSLIPPPISSPMLPSLMQHASPSLPSFGSLHSFGSSSSLANYRSSSQSRAQYVPSHPASAAQTRQPSFGSASYSSSSTFEPGSAPATASLYASYAASFQRTPSVEARLASFGSPRRMSTTSISSSLRSSRFHGSGEDLRGRMSGTTSATRMRSRSRASSSEVVSEEEEGGGGGSGFSRSQPHQITPTQSSLLSAHERPPNPRRLSNVSTDSNSGASRPASVLSSDRHSHEDQPLRVRRSTPSGDDSPPSTVDESAYLCMPPPSSTIRSKPPPAPSRKPHAVGSVERRTVSGEGWSWGREKMYEIPRVTTDDGRGGVASEKSSFGAGGKLFYWGE